MDVRVVDHPLAAAATEGARELTVICHQMTWSGETAKGIASEYDSVDSGAGTRIADV